MTSGVVKFNSKVGFGALGLTWTGAPPPREQSFETLLTAVNNGVDLIDSGEFYGIDPIEANLILLQDFFAKYPELRQKVKLCIKGAFNIKTMQPDSSKEAISASINNILKYIDFIDIFECARIDVNVPIEETISYIKEFIDAGKVGGIALSESKAETIKRAHKVHPLSAVELEFSLWAREIIQTDVYKTCYSLGIPILAYSPLGKGFLTGSLKNLNDIPETDIRKIVHLDRFVDEEAFNNNLKIVHFLEPIAAAKKISLSQLALAWIEKFPGIIPIPGTSKPSRVLENLKHVELSDEEFEKINKFLDSFTVKGLRYNEKLESFLMN
ncbi:hypothetical protein PACTADRAFT_37371 [Pachysolen tannophilus NRRL Y-2460]|uniref:NADP-dependent oxidoreductase domain-containing protein n=1 Tax=Pachysolen tannophilus NRRL Y-2460 TaxID=669874 RepID=A0A1E4U0Z0_PACTA|nr:hypothetical protein PACTADRAFT_37371 [Pachysolen tannophilus NRRL Y-2460]